MTTPVLCRRLPALCVALLLLLAAEGIKAQETRPTTGPSTTASASATSRLKVLFSGTESGHATFERHPDGTFSAVGELTIGTLKIAEQITGRFDGAQLAQYRLAYSQPGQPDAALDYEGGKLVAVRGGKRDEADAGQTGPLLFANLIPQMSAAALGSVEWPRKEPQPVSIYMLEAGRKVEVTVTPQKERPTKAGVARVFKVEMGPLAMEMATASEGGAVVAMDVPAQKLRWIADGWEDLYVDPLAAYPELSQPTHEVTIERAVPMRTRDGVMLVADVYRPAGQGRFPTILSRTPYGRATAGIDGPFWAARGYAFVAQDVRGMGESEGEWDPFVRERKDGYDAVEWASTRPWSDGKIGMIGASYGGLVQWAAASERHPALKCIVPQVSPPDAMRNIPYDHGTFFLFGNLWWAQIVRGKQADFSGMFAALPNAEKIATLPLSRVDDAMFGQSVPFFDKWLEREGLAAWDGFDWLDDLAQVDVPALHVSGWWDGDGIGTKLNWQAMRAAGRSNQWLIYGPWTHAFNTTTTLGDVDYGPGAILELDSLYVRWFDTWLKGKDVGLDRVPRVRVFVTGANRWLDLADWPDEKAGAARTLYLFADAPANGKTSKGQLRDAPAEAQEPSRYLYNPADASFPAELLSMDPADATTVVKLGEAHNDDGTLAFRTAPLDQALAIGGPITLDLHFETTARDTDFYASIVDVDEQGTMRQIGQSGKLRAAFLGGMGRPRPVTPGEVYKATIDLWDTAHEFAPGHRIGLLITSGRFPVMARNLGTGEPIKDATRMVVQVNTIHHDRARPSALTFRVLWEGDAPPQPTTRRE